MVDKCSSYSKIILDFWLLSEMTTEYYEATKSFFVVCKHLGEGGGGGWDTTNCQMPGPSRLISYQIYAQGLPGGMLAAGID